MTTLRFQLSGSPFSYGKLDGYRADKTENRMSEGSIQSIFDDVKKQGWVPPTPTTRKILKAFQLTQGGDGRFSCETLAMDLTTDIRMQFGNDFLATSFSIIQNQVDEIRESKMKAKGR
jgi:hypothetical protein